MTEIGFQGGRAKEGQLLDLLARQRAKPHFLGRVRREVSLLKKSRWYGSGGPSLQLQ
nr:hypothetical protein [Herbaspirillum sp. B39]